MQTMQINISLVKVLYLFTFILGLRINAFAQESQINLRKEIDVLKEEQQAIRNDLKEIKELLIQKVSPQIAQQMNVRGVAFELPSGSISKGNSPLVLIEFTDYQCQYCQRYARETLPDILSRYVEKHTVDYAIIDQPLPAHENASKAAEASHCANDQGKYWEMHNLMMSTPALLSDLSSYAKTLNLNISQFQECINSSKYAPIVANGILLASKLGTSVVPAFLLAFRDSRFPNKLTGISYMRGAQPFTSFQKEIDNALKFIVSSDWPETISQSFPIPPIVISIPLTDSLRQ